MLRQCAEGVVRAGSSRQLFDGGGLLRQGLKRVGFHREGYVTRPGELLGGVGDLGDGVLFAGGQPLGEAFHGVSAQLGKYPRWAVDAELFLEPTDGGAAHLGDGALDLPEAGQQAVDQAADDHVAELGELHRQIEA
ncbi:hypothetical protein D9M68_694510 [compost metagenome]